MKRSLDLTLCVLAILFAMATVLHAQAPAPSVTQTAATKEGNDATVELMRKDVRSERKKIIAASMPLTEAEATRFWPVYDQYIAEKTKVNDQRYAVIKAYAQAYNTNALTNEQADSLIKRWLSTEQDDSQLRLRFLPEFEKIISNKKAALFFQLDHRLDMIVELQLASQVPLVEP